MELEAEREDGCGWEEEDDWAKGEGEWMLEEPVARGMPTVSVEP